MEKLSTSENWTFLTLTQKPDVGGILYFTTNSKKTSQLNVMSFIVNTAAVATQVPSVYLIMNAY